jgi:hypothetical protein
MWLAGNVREGGGNGDVGEGALYRSQDGGRFWEEVPKNAFDSGKGSFHWGGRPYGWTEIGPIKSILMFERALSGGVTRTEGWIAAITGVYQTKAGTNWGRSTPPPADGEYRYPFTHFEKLSSVEAFSEIYAVGWQGIADFSGADSAWSVQKSTGTYAIGGISEFGGSENRSVWAAGMAGIDERGNEGDKSHGAIYHLSWPSDKWQAVDLKSIRFDTGQSFADIVVVDHDRVFAVGQGGLVVRGTATAGTWTWTAVKPLGNTDESLSGVCYDHDSGLWIVGNAGSVLSSIDLGKHWTITHLKTRDGKPAALARVRFFDGMGWIVGDGVVYRSSRR